VRPADLAAAADALFRGAEAMDEAGARAALHAAFPRASAKLGQLLRLEIALTHETSGATSVQVAVRLAPEGLRPTAPGLAAFIERYLKPIRARAGVVDAGGAAWWTLEGEQNLWTLRLRIRGGSLVPLDGDAARRIPASLRLTGDYATRMGSFKIAASRLAADVALTRTPLEKGFVLRFRQEPAWDLPFILESLLGAPLHYPFAGPGSEAGWAARETASGTRLERHYRVRVGENFILRWLGGMTSRAVSDFRSGAEAEAERFYAECLAAIRDDVQELLGSARNATQSPSITLPMPIASSTEPSPLRPRPMPGMAREMRSARRLSGSDCSQTWPGPVSVAKNSPSPPKKAVLTPPTSCTS
jgi:hypothetical protein